MSPVPAPIHPANLLDAIRDIAIEAGRRILDVYERDFAVEEKRDGSPLTAADRAAQEVISAGLAALEPACPILSEEAVEISWAERRQWRRLWLVDPLDGTREFVSRNGEFTVNIALIEAGEPALGVVYVPLLGVTYYAARGHGAFRRREGEPARPVRARPYAGGPPIVVASRSHPGEQLAGFLKRLGPHETVAMGSALKLCLVAEGTADLYPRLGPTMEWDTAAAHCIVEAAGGRITDTTGRPLVYNKESLLNPWFIVSGPGETDWTRFLAD
jgi:3'(2'), 5'-bisphosphate nucleotidase